MVFFEKVLQQKNRTPLGQKIPGPKCPKNGTEKTRSQMSPKWDRKNPVPNVPFYKKYLLKKMRNDKIQV